MCQFWSSASYRTHCLKFLPLPSFFTNTRFFFSVAFRPDFGVWASLSHSLDTPHSVALLWTSDQPDLCLATLDTHNRQTSMTPAGFEPAITASERPQTQALDRAATGIGPHTRYSLNIERQFIFGVPCHWGLYPHIPYIPSITTRRNGFIPPFPIGINSMMLNELSKIVYFPLNQIWLDTSSSSSSSCSWRLGVFPVPWSSRWSWSLHLFLGRPIFLHPFGLYCSACFGSLFVSILCTCCSHFW